MKKKILLCLIEILIAISLCACGEYNFPPYEKISPDGSKIVDNTNEIEYTVNATEDLIEIIFYSGLSHKQMERYIEQNPISAKDFITELIRNSEKMTAQGQNQYGRDYRLTILTDDGSVILSVENGETVYNAYNIVVGRLEDGE